MLGVLGVLDRMKKSSCRLGCARTENFGPMMLWPVMPRGNAFKATTQMGMFRRLLGLQARHQQSAEARKRDDIPRFGCVGRDELRVSNVDVASRRRSVSVEDEQGGSCFQWLS
ncbi:hypothetical protein E4U54_008686 [Claviceps lovelessii]|nr:hypothetical protein E4U54_008686 [Claviceps lovelessii]